MNSLEQFHLGFKMVLVSVPIMTFLLLFFTYTQILPYYLAYPWLIPCGIGIILMLTEPNEKPLSKEGVQ